MRKRLNLLVGFALICVFMISACAKESSIADDTSSDIEISVDLFYEANTNAIYIEDQEIIMENEVEGKAKIKVQLPDYEKLYKEAYKSPNPDKYLLEVLEGGVFDICEYEIEARVNIENGQNVIHTDEAIKALLEQELAKAIDALVEGE